MKKSENIFKTKYLTELKINLLLRKWIYTVQNTNRGISVDLNNGVFELSATI